MKLNKRNFFLNYKETIVILKNLLLWEKKSYDSGEGNCSIRL